MKAYEFNINGMSCGSCVQKISDALSSEKSLVDVAVDLGTPNLRFRSLKELGGEDINRMLAPLKKYKAMPVDSAVAARVDIVKTLTLYWPLILLFGLSAAIPALYAGASGVGVEEWMYKFMGVTLVALSYFKLLDLPKFADGFSTYDPIAGRVRAYGYIYPFLELISGIAFLMSFAVQLVSILVILFLASTTFGVARALAEKRKFQCACLGTIFKLPLTKVTIIENTLMMVMAIMVLA